MTIKELIKRSFDLWCRKNWLRQIDKECKRRDRHFQRYQHHKEVAKVMWAKYEEEYGKVN